MVGIPSVGGRGGERKRMVWRNHFDSQREGAIVGNRDGMEEGYFLNENVRTSLLESDNPRLFLPSFRFPCSLALRFARARFDTT